MHVCRPLCVWVSIIVEVKGHLHKISTFAMLLHVIGGQLDEVGREF